MHASSSNILAVWESGWCIFFYVDVLVIRACVGRCCCCFRFLPLFSFPSLLMRRKISLWYVAYWRKDMCTGTIHIMVQNSLIIHRHAEKTHTCHCRCEMNKQSSENRTHRAHKYKLFCHINKQRQKHGAQETWKDKKQHIFGAKRKCRKQKKYIKELNNI